MVKTARTIDIVVVLGATTWMVKPNKILDLSITGNASPTNQAFLGIPDEAATLHTISQTFEIGTIYDGDESDALRSHIADDTDMWVAVISPTANLESWEAALVPLNSLPETAPPDDAITDALSLPISARASFGIGADSVTRFLFSAGVGSVSIGDIAVGASVLLIVDAESVGAAAFNVTPGGIATTVAGPGIQKIGPFASAVSSAVVSTTTSLAGAEEISGYVLVGEEQGVPGG